MLLLVNLLKIKSTKIYELKMYNILVTVNIVEYCLI